MFKTGLNTGGMVNLKEAICWPKPLVLGLICPPAGHGTVICRSPGLQYDTAVFTWIVVATGGEDPALLDAATV
jgi:hypothetical protein